MRLPRLKRGAGLGREIALTLALKGLVLYALWAVFFSQPAIHGLTEGMDPGRVAAALAAPPTPTASFREPTP